MLTLLKEISTHRTLCTIVADHYDVSRKMLANKPIAFTLLSALLTSGSFAQAPAIQAVGVVIRVEGLVTVSQGDSLGNVFKDEIVLQNARVVTTASGSTTIKLNSGCIIDLKPNQAVTVDFRRDCKTILASILPTGAGGSVGVGAVGVPPGLNNAIFVGGGVLIGLGVINAISKSNESSALQRLSGS